MSATDLEYTHPSDNLAGTVTPTLVAATEATGYEIAHLYDNDPAYPFKTVETSFRLVWNFGSPVTPALVALIHPNFSTGAVVDLEMNSVDDWYLPNYSRPFPAATYHEDDFPANLHLDLRASPMTGQYLSIVVSTPSSVACSIGEIVIASQIRFLDGRFQRDAEEDETHPLISHATDVGVKTKYSHGTRLRWVRGDHIHEAADDAKIRSWNRAAQGTALPFLLLPHLRVEEVWLCCFETLPLTSRYLGGGSAAPFVTSTRLNFEEVARGLKPTPSAV